MTNKGSSPYKKKIICGDHLRYVLITYACLVSNLVYSQACDPVGPFGIAVAGPPNVIGQWDPPAIWPAQATHAQLLDDRSVLWWRAGEPTTAYLFDPATAVNAPTLSVATNLFCAGHTTLADGRTLVVGGTLLFTNALGAPDTNTYDAATGSWTRVADMHYGRWYPTATALPDGRVIAVAGSMEPGGVRAQIPEIYDPASDTWSELPDAELALPNYPFNFALPDGRLLVAGPGATSYVLNLQTTTWEAVDAAEHASAFAGSAAMYRPGKILRVGGGNPATGAADVLDMTQAAPAWREVTPMTFARRRPDLVLLPDGNALAIGGSTAAQSDPLCAVHAPEVWDAESETWTSWAPMTRPRIYHSVAILLADGRVLVAGGENETLPGGERNAEIFSPPYLFTGPRPVINGAPAVLEYGAQFNLNVQDRDAVESIALIRPGSVTHNFDQNQRYVPLSFELGTGKKRLRVTGPADANLAPPGTYMLFVVSDAGTPSEAQFVSIGAPCQATEEPELSCDDGIDNDCDGAVDGSDSDCASGACDGDGICEPGEDCRGCPGDCASRLNGKPDGRFCCGDGLSQPAESDGLICDYNP